MNTIHDIFEFIVLPLVLVIATLLLKLSSHNRAIKRPDMSLQDFGLDLTAMCIFSIIVFSMNLKFRYSHSEGAENFFYFCSIFCLLSLVGILGLTLYLRGIGSHSVKGIKVQNITGGFYLMILVIGVFVGRYIVSDEIHSDESDSKTDYLVNLETLIFAIFVAYVLGIVSGVLVKRTSKTKPPPENLSVKAFEQYKKGNIEESIKIRRKIIDENEHYDKGDKNIYRLINEYFSLFEIYNSQNNYQKALSNIEKAIKLATKSPEFSHVYLNFSVEKIKVLCKMNKMDKAKICLTGLKTSYSNDPKVVKIEQFILSLPNQ